MPWPSHQRQIATAAASIPVAGSSTIRRSWTSNNSSLRGRDHSRGYGPRSTHERGNSTRLRLQQLLASSAHVQTELDDATEADEQQHHPYTHILLVLVVCAHCCCGCIMTAMLPNSRSAACSRPLDPSSSCASCTSKAPESRKEKPTLSTTASTYERVYPREPEREPQAETVLLFHPLLACNQPTDRRSILYARTVLSLSLQVASEAVEVARAGQLQIEGREIRLAFHRPPASQQPSSVASTPSSVCCWRTSPSIH